MILNFYLRKHTPLPPLRRVERQNLASVRILLKRRGVENAHKLGYHAAIQRLAALIAKEGIRSR